MPIRDKVARRVANLHFRIEPGISKIVRLISGEESDADLEEPVKLLEVNEDTIPSGVVPIYFRRRPEKGVDYPILIVEITPNEFERLGSELALPEGWVMADELERPQVV